MELFHILAMAVFSSMKEAAIQLDLLLPCDIKSFHLRQSMTPKDAVTECHSLVGLGTETFLCSEAEVQDQGASWDPSLSYMRVSFIKL